LIQETAVAQVHTYKQRDIDLTEEVKELREKNRASEEAAASYEEALGDLRQRVEELEEKFFVTENKSVSIENELSEAQQELLRSKQAAQSYLEEVTRLLDEKKDTEKTLTKLQGDLDGLRGQYTDLEDVVYKRTAEKLAKAEDTIE
jgi:chromosome segregation ATPase